MKIIKNPWLSLLSLGKTGIYDLEIPLVVISTDIENGVMTIRPLEGLMDDAD